MNLEPRLRTMLIGEADQTEVRLDPDVVVRKARRKRRRLQTGGSAIATVVVVAALAIGIPTLTPDGTGRDARPAAPEEQSNVPDRGLIESGKNAEGLPLTFTVIADRWLAFQRLNGKTPDIVFFAEIKPAPRYNWKPTDRIPRPEPGSGYTSFRLRDRDGDGEYTANARVELGRYVVAIYASDGVRRAADGVYPAKPYELVTPAEPTIEQALVVVRGSSGYATYYRPN